MELKNTVYKLTERLKKYKYAILVLLLGIALMVYPGSDKKKEEDKPIKTIQVQTIPLEEQLSQTLSCVHGAGKVKVLLSVCYGEETIYQTDQNITDNKDASTHKIDTVTVDHTGLIKQINPPIYKGAIVISQGANDPKVRLEIVEAVSKLTGIGADRISVLKMN